jgi:hypothetical protein
MVAKAGPSSRDAGSHRPLLAQNQGTALPAAWDFFGSTANVRTANAQDRIAVGAHGLELLPTLLLRFLCD